MRPATQSRRAASVGSLHGAGQQHKRQDAGLGQANAGHVRPGRCTSILSKAAPATTERVAGARWSWMTAILQQRRVPVVEEKNIWSPKASAAPAASARYMTGPLPCPPRRCLKGPGRAVPPWRYNGL